MPAVGFTDRSAKRISKSVQWTERQVRNRRGHRSRFVTATAGVQLTHAKTTAGGIAAASGATMGSALCDLYNGADGTLTDTGDDATIYNTATSAVAANTFIIAAKINGLWVVIVEDCG